MNGTRESRTASRGTINRPVGSSVARIDPFRTAIVRRGVHSHIFFFFVFSFRLSNTITVRPLAAFNKSVPTNETAVSSCSPYECANSRTHPLARDTEYYHRCTPLRRIVVIALYTRGVTGAAMKKRYGRTARRSSFSDHAHVEEAFCLWNGRGHANASRTSRRPADGAIKPRASRTVAKTSHGRRSALLHVLGATFRPIRERCVRASRTGNKTETCSGSKVCDKFFRAALTLLRIFHLRNPDPSPLLE